MSASLKPRVHPLTAHKRHGALGSVFAQARKAKVDILLLLELHTYT